MAILDIADTFSNRLDEVYGTSRRKGMRRVGYELTRTPSRKIGIPLLAGGLAIGLTTIFFLTKGSNKKAAGAQLSPRPEAQHGETQARTAS